MKNLFFILLIIVTTQSVKGQIDEDKNSSARDLPEKVVKKASFPGDYKKYIESNINYPKEVRKKGIEGSVYIMCVIDTAGVIIESSVWKGLHPLLDNEALRVINGMPKWEPATIDGRAIKSKIMIPIRFSLSN